MVYARQYYALNFQMTSKMFLDIVGVITTSKLCILSTFQGGLSAPPPCQVGLNCYLISFPEKTHAVSLDFIPNCFSIVDNTADK